MNMNAHYPNAQMPDAPPTYYEAIETKSKTCTNENYHYYQIPS